MANGVLEYVWCPYCKEFEGCVFEDGYYTCPVTGKRFPKP